jgi:membrane protease YdiL (CAAX protease family)
MNAVLSSTQAVETPRRVQIALAWSAVLILAVPRILYRLIVPAAPGEMIAPYWLAGAQVAVLVALWAASWFWPIVRPLRGFFLILAAMGVGSSFLLPLAAENRAWFARLQQASWGAWWITYRLVTHLLMAGIMALTLIGSGIGRRELFLARGNPSAPASPTPLLQGRKTAPWNHIIRTFLPIYALIVVVIEVLLVRPQVSRIPRALLALPAILLSAAINAFGEEFEFRSMVLARLEPVLGPQQAIWLAAGLFGLMHYFGAPGSIQGVLLAAYLGWIAAKSMIETRSIIWAFLLHFVGNLLIFFFMALVAA